MKASEELPVYLRIVNLVALGVLFFMLTSHIFEVTGTGFSQEQIYTDVQCYRSWAFNGLSEGSCFGTTLNWVYPIAAMLPFWAAAVLGYMSYMWTWVMLTAVLNLLAIGTLSRWGTSTAGTIAGIWWMLSLLCIAALAGTRLDAVSAPIAIMSMVLITSMPVLASTLMALATWIKVWPAAIVVSGLIVLKQRLTILLTGLAVTAAIVVLTVSTGNASHLLSFISEQDERSLQIEALATVPMYIRLLTVGADVQVVYNREINTFEFDGAGAGVVASLLGVGLIIALLAVAALLLWALREKVPATELFPLGAFALAGSMMVFNKVGSPQFLMWLLAIAAVGLSVNWRTWQMPALLLFLAALLTGVYFPAQYKFLLELNPEMLTVVLLRNVLILAAIAWIFVELINKTRHARELHLGTGGTAQAADPRSGDAIRT